MLPFSPSRRPLGLCGPASIICRGPVPPPRLLEAARRSRVSLYLRACPRSRARQVSQAAAPPPHTWSQAYQARGRPRPTPFCHCLLPHRQPRTARPAGCQVDAPEHLPRPCPILLTCRDGRGRHPFCRLPSRMCPATNPSRQQIEAPCLLKKLHGLQHPTIHHRARDFDGIPLRSVSLGGKAHR
ncbi:hypothetical protein NDU88_005169 [Pleurodeles waltl]|uniref:Uncharacterized protein n=1 Tax=Pleurodeles waltl TaxID=8319 RepID=A0AAV7WZX3_PLEWA|nr:hypothetical protein NDU88_005169 [Pleurodeles waltl]